MFLAAFAFQNAGFLKYPITQDHSEEISLKNFISYQKAGPSIKKLAIAGLRNEITKKASFKNWPFFIVKLQPQIGQQEFCFSRFAISV